MISRVGSNLSAALQDIERRQRAALRSSSSNALSIVSGPARVSQLDPESAAMQQVAQPDAGGKGGVGDGTGDEEGLGIA